MPTIKKVSQNGSPTSQSLNGYPSTSEDVPDENSAVSNAPEADAAQSKPGQPDTTITNPSPLLQRSQKPRSSASSTTSSTSGSSVTSATRRLESVPGATSFERALYALEHDDKWIKEIALGKRVGFYRLKGELGSGNFSQVKLAVHHLTKEKTAVKTLDKSKLDIKTQRMLNREINIMEQLCHPHVIQLYEVIDTFSKTHLILEYADAGELFAKITAQGRISEDHAKVIFAQIASAVDYLHSRNVIHRDLKSENVFLCGGSTFGEGTVAKVGDFGFSTTVRHVDEALRTFCGSPPYAAPELFQEECYVGIPVDIWALGILLFFMVTGQMPFQAQTVASLKRCILEGRYEIPPHVSPECTDLVQGILRRDVQGRHTMAQIIRSPWLVQHTAAVRTLEDGPRHRWGQRAPSCSKTTDSRHAYHPWPRLDPSMRDQLEIEVRERMLRLGITDQIIREHTSGGCRDQVIGTFRILMSVAHRKRMASTNTVTAIEQVANGDLPEKFVGQSLPLLLKKKQTNGSMSSKASKACVLL